LGIIQNAVFLGIIVFGERQCLGYAGVISKFAKRVSGSLPPAIYSDGNQTRDFIIVDDLIDPILLPADVASFSGVRVFDVRTAMATKIKDLVLMLIKIFNLDF
jgi:UDP-glucose 4-epimerase